MKRRLFYDCEIVSPIRGGSDWRNYTYLGVSVIGCYASWLPQKQRLQAFTHDEGFEGFQKLVNQAEEIVGFNSIGFDDPLCRAHGVHIETTYDLMVEVRRAAGEPLSGPCTSGYNLARLAKRNLGREKTGHGAKVPDLWQQGKRQEVIDYCLNDVMLLVGLYQRRTHLIDPVYYETRVLHCDPLLTNWREVRAEISQLFSERIARIQIERNMWHWSGARITFLSLVIAESLIVKFPVWLHQSQSWRDYVGLPFNERLPTVDLTVEDFLNSDDNEKDFDPIPF
jgi:hypothetical protein